MAYFTRVLSKQEGFPTFDDLVQFLQAEQPHCRLAVEDGDEEDWSTLLLSTDDEIEIALIERNPVFDGSVGQDEIADFLEELRDGKPESAVQWLGEYLEEVRTIYAFQHLQGSEMEDGGNALHALRSMLLERGEAILQADGEGFTNEEGYHIVWQFSDSVSGPWKMAVLQDGTWHTFSMDLGDPGHRAAFLAGEIPPDASAIHS